jgi:hypothetical protein
MRFRQMGLKRTGRQPFTVAARIMPACLVSKTNMTPTIRYGVPPAWEAMLS